MRPFVTSLIVSCHGLEAIPGKKTRLSRGRQSDVVHSPIIFSRSRDRNGLVEECNVVPSCMEF